MAEDYRHRQIDTSTVSSTAQFTYDQMKADFDALDPVSIGNACSAWASVASTLGDAADNIRPMFADQLAQAWDSEAAADAQKQLQLAQATASALAEQCMTMARATDYAANYARWYKEHFPRDVGPSGVSDEGVQNAADHTGNYLTRLNEVIASALPPEVSARYLTVNPQQGRDDFTVGAGGPGSVPAPGTVHPGALGAHVPGATGGTHGSPFGDVSGQAPGNGDWPGTGQVGPTGGSSLGDWDPGTATAGAGELGGGAGLGTGLSGAGGVHAGGGGAGGGLGAGLGTGLGAGLGAGAAATGLGTGRGGGPGAGARGGVPGAGTGNRATAAPGRGGVSGTGPGNGAMAPMHGGVAPDGETEHDRTTWLTEDDDVWGGDSSAPPPVIRS